MVSQSSYHHGLSLGASKSRVPGLRWSNLRQKLSSHKSQTSAPINTSSTTVDSSDISLKNGIPAVAAGDLSSPSLEWGHGNQAIPTAFRPTFYKLLSKLAPQSPSPNNGHYKTQGTTSHQTRSNKPEKAGQRRKSSSKGARDFGSGSGSGSGPGSGGGGKGGKGNGPPPPDGWRFPHLGDARPPKHLGCPFYLTDPLRHHQCSNLRLSRPSDVSLHLFRKHVLREINLGTTSTDTTEADENAQHAGSCKNADGITRYHPTCRMEFHGPNAEEKLRNHCLNWCDEAGIEESGVMLPSEFEKLKKARDGANGTVAKWYAMWRICYPPISTRGRIVPASPYVETTVPREQCEHIIRQALLSSTNQRVNPRQIVDEIYFGETDREVQRIVQIQQEEPDSEVQEAFTSTSTSSHPPSTGFDLWSLPLQQEAGVEHAFNFPSSSMTLPLQQQHGLLAGQSNNSIENSFGSFQQQSQMQLPYQNTSSNFSHPGAPPETPDPASQQAMEWHCYNPNWNLDGSQ
ncbi:hypothetical protein LB503_002601 [Fusarium chuoi]|nr:hypothetical protein LB503_002601 [Fusarium chuoi]